MNILMLIKHALMEKAGDGQGGGGSGGGSAGAALHSGSGNPPASGGAGAGASGGAAGGANGGGAGAGASASGGNAQSIQFPENWKLALDSELQEDPSLKLINDVPSLAKSYVNAQKMVGADKIPVPGKHATEDDWKAVYQKLGLPKDVKEYGIEAPKDAGFDDEFIGQFKAAAHQANILPQQAQKLVNWFAEASKAAGENMQKQFQEREEQGLAKLKEEWGQAYNNKVAAANQALKDFADEGTRKFFYDNLANNAQMIKFLATIHEKMGKEDIVRGNGGGGDPVYTPAEAQKEYNKIIGDMNHPYHQKAHPGHKSAVEEVQRLFGMAFPSKP